MRFKRKSIITVKDATRMAFRSMDNRFNAIRLCQAVRHLTGRAFLMDATILRRLRELREEDPEIFTYRVIDSEESIYSKQNSKTQNGQIQLRNQAEPCM